MVHEHHLSQVVVGTVGEFGKMELYIVCLLIGIFIALLVVVRTFLCCCDCREDLAVDQVYPAEHADEISLGLLADV
ncbi:hypothetical protein L596_023180 [Steinernema carpocapsae]|uniref:Uncharacterized protein n=1 Tax=Steinernema carpocapsae TaxID=34508 RepID=A0A4U5MCW7_STECR|nr:hypothetical protein L596_023180 [Steinernema carpocapsae]